MPIAASAHDETHAPAHTARRRFLHLARCLGRTGARAAAGGHERGTDDLGSVRGEFYQRTSAT
jgi:hypothetical protein